MKKTRAKVKPAARKKSAAKAARPASTVALKGTVAIGKPPKGELRHVPWNSIAVEMLTPLLGRQFVAGQNVMLARMVLKKGCIVPEHSHPNEQVSYVLEGALKFWIDGQVIVVNAGEVLTIPPNMPHRVEAFVDTVGLDVFSPPRADWMSGTDAYLR